MYLPGTLGGFRSPRVLAQQGNAILKVPLSTVHPTSQQNHQHVAINIKRSKTGSEIT